MYNLQLINDWETGINFDKTLKDYRLLYTGQEIKRYINALDWALKNKGQNFKQLLPNIQLSNSQILSFFDALLSELRRFFDQKTLQDMMVPDDSRKLNILVLDDLKYGHTDLIFAHTTYTVFDVHRTLDALIEYTNKGFDLLILSLNQSPGALIGFLAELTDADSKMGKADVPKLILSDLDNKLNNEILDRLGFVSRLTLPVPKYKLLQEVYKLTTR